MAMRSLIDVMKRQVTPVDQQLDQLMQVEIWENREIIETVGAYILSKIITEN